MRYNLRGHNESFLTVNLTLLAHGADPFAMFLQPRSAFNGAYFTKPPEDSDLNYDEPQSVAISTRATYEASRIPKGYE